MVRRKGDISVDDIANLALLRDVDVTNGRYYAPNLGVKSLKDLSWLTQSGLAWEAAEMDAIRLEIDSPEEYIAMVEHNFYQFMETGIVYDRDDLYKFFKSTLGKGSLSLLLGGKSVGKSLLLKDITESTNTGKMESINGDKMAILYINGRSKAYAPISEALKLGWEQLAADYPEMFPQQTMTEFFAFGSRAKQIIDAQQDQDGKAGKLFDSFLDIIAPNPQDKGKPLPCGVLVNLLLTLVPSVSDEDALALFVEKAKAVGRKPILIIDEANLVLLDKDEHDNAASQFLKYLVQLTKEERELTVVLTSSEHDYPYLLESTGFNLNDVQNKVFIGEIPPKDMFDLLTSATYKMYSNNGKAGTKGGEKIVGMGPNLARLFVSAYGGHVQRISQGVESIALAKENYEIAAVLNKISQNVTMCIKEANFRERSKMISLLKEMALTGFVPLSDIQADNVVMITKSSVGGVVERGSTMPGIPPTVWANTEYSYALVPTSESARLVIAKAVFLWMEENKGMWPFRRREKDR
jgi:hypothetical protein